MAISDKIMNRMVNAINSADLEAAAKQVALMRERFPNATTEELADQLIRRKCLQAGSVGAVTSGAAIIPGLGTFTSLTFGVAADIGITFKLQAELVLEMAQLYEHELTEGEKRTLILTVTGISSGGNQVFSKVGQQLAKKATAELTRKSVTKAIPFLGVAASGGVNMATTYYIGQRAKAYFSLGEDEMMDFGESARALTGVDERKLVDWLGETTSNSWEFMSEGLKTSKENVVLAGQSTGKIIMLGSNKLTRSIVEAGKWVGSGITAVSGSVASLFKRNKNAGELADADAAPALLEKATVEDEQVIGVIAAGDDELAVAEEETGRVRRLVEKVAWWRDDVEDAEGETAVANLPDDEEYDILVEEETDDEPPQTRRRWLRNPFG